MKKYPKISNIFKRREGNNKGLLIDGAWTKLEFEVLQNISWEASEKIDGTNISIVWDQELSLLELHGRTANALIPSELVNLFVDRFSVDLFRTLKLPSMIIYGEGYGRGIQKIGSQYKSDGVDTRVFDIWCGGFWLSRANIFDITMRLPLGRVPQFFDMNLEEAMKMVEEGFDSRIGGSAQAEGLVLKAPYGMLDRRGDRIMLKVKTCDFKRGLYCDGDDCNLAV